MEIFQQVDDESEEAKQQGHDSPSSDLDDGAETTRPRHMGHEDGECAAALRPFAEICDEQEAEREAEQGQEDFVGRFFDAWANGKAT